MKAATSGLAVLAPFLVALAPAGAREARSACEQECYTYCHGSYGSPKRKLVCQSECIRKCHEERGEVLKHGATH